jgi:magnesium chelatase accessory protein
MMANWKLDELEADLPALKHRLLLVAGRGDRTIAPAEAMRVRNLVPGARLELLPNLGHLAHEEQPAQIAALIRTLHFGAGSTQASA